MKKVNIITVFTFVCMPNGESEKVFERTIKFQSRAAMKKAYLNMYETYSLFNANGKNSKDDFGETYFKEFAMENVGRMMVFETKENGIEKSTRVIMHYYLKSQNEVFEEYTKALEEVGIDPMNYNDMRLCGITETNKAENEE